MVVSYDSNSHRHILRIMSFGELIRTQEEFGAIPSFAKNVGNTVGIYGFAMIESVMIFVAIRT